jgi:exonuclease III
MKSPTKSNIPGTNSHFSLISLNINGFNSPIKRYKLTDWIHKQDTTFCCMQEINLNDKDRHYLSIKDGKRSSKQMVPGNKLELPY